MSSVAYVNSSSAGQVTPVPRGTSATITVSASLALTVGNTLVVVVGGIADGAGNVTSWSCTDNASPTPNVYTLIQHRDAGTQLPGLALFTAPIVTGGTLNITASAQASIIVGLATGYPGLCIAPGQFTGIGQTNGSAIQQNGPAGGTVNLTTANSGSVNVVTNFTTPSLQNQFSACAVDISGFSIDMLVAGCSGGTGDTSAIPTTSVGTYTLVQNPNISAGAGVFSIGLFYEGGGIIPPSITCGSPPAGQVGVSYSHTFPASDGTPPYTFSIISGSLPPGLSLNSSTGVVSGTPTTANTYPFTIQVTDSTSATASVACSIVINPAPPSITCNNPPAGIVGTAYTHTFPASGGVPPYTFSIISGSLPPGIVLNAATGIVSGVPTSAGSYPFTIQVTDSLSASGNVACSISITNPVVPPVSLGCGNPPMGVVGIFYSNGLAITGGTPPYTFFLGSGSLPLGLTLNSTTGVISGTPTGNGGTYLFIAEVIDSKSQISSVSCSITITICTGVVSNAGF